MNQDVSCHTIARVVLKSENILLNCIDKHTCNNFYCNKITVLRKCNVRVMIFSYRSSTAE